MSDVTAIGFVFLAIFFLTMIGTYIVIRRKLMRMRSVGALAAVINVASLMAYGFTNDEIGDELAIIGGFVVGLGFTGAMLTMAAFFQNNEPQALAAYDAMVRKQKTHQASAPTQDAPQNKQE
ncbi:MAG: hypothetical protein GYB66_13270 [Chloroflexi bacterium]|nr:hypothetical protein [Chloroflexota bacterium]